MVDSEKQLIKNMSKEVEKIADIPKVQRHFQRKLKKADTQMLSGIRKWLTQRQLSKISGKRERRSITLGKQENCLRGIENEN